MKREKEAEGRERLHTWDEEKAAEGLYEECVGMRWPKDLVAA